VFDQGTGAVEAGGVTGFGQDGRRPDRGDAGDAGEVFGQAQLVEHLDHAGFDLGQAGWAGAPVGQHPAGAF
jgi:hypothetical protein